MKKHVQVVSLADLLEVVQTKGRRWLGEDDPPPIIGKPMGTKRVPKPSQDPRLFINGLDMGYVSAAEVQNSADEVDVTMFGDWEERKIQGLSRVEMSVEVLVSNETNDWQNVSGLMMRQMMVLVELRLEHVSWKGNAMLRTYERGAEQMGFARIRLGMVFTGPVSAIDTEGVEPSFRTYEREVPPSRAVSSPSVVVKPTGVRKFDLED